MKILSGAPARCVRACASGFIRGHRMVTKKNTADLLLVTKAVVTGKLPVTAVSYRYRSNLPVTGR